MPKKVDSNQKAVTAILRTVPGVSVALTHSIGKGFVDMIVGYNGLNLLVELKDPFLPPSKKKLTSDEKKFHKNWKGKAVVAETALQILNELGIKLK